jgi:hypothetical protein
MLSIRYTTAPDERQITSAGRIASLGALPSEGRCSPTLLPSVAANGRPRGRRGSRLPDRVISSNGATGDGARADWTLTFANETPATAIAELALSRRFQKNNRSARSPSRAANSRAPNPLASHCCTRSFQNRSSRRNRAIRASAPQSTKRSATRQDAVRRTDTDCHPTPASTAARPQFRHMPVLERGATPRLTVRSGGPQRPQAGARIALVLRRCTASLSSIAV